MSFVFIFCVCTCAGHYCPEGSPSPVQCPPGTNTTSVGLRSMGDCESCVKGYYCPSNGTVLSEKKCLAGVCGYECYSSSVCLSVCLCAVLFGILSDLFVAIRVNVLRILLSLGHL